MSLNEWRALQVQPKKRAAPPRPVNLVRQKYEVREDGSQVTVLPVRLESRANFRGFTGSRKHRNKIRSERELARIVFTCHATKPEMPCKILLVRIAPCKLDRGDNLNMSFKSIRDGICDWLGIDDSTDQITWDYDQEKDLTPRTYGCRVEIFSGKLPRTCILSSPTARNDQPCHS